MTNDIHGRGDLAAIPVMIASEPADLYLPDWWSARAEDLRSLLDERGALLFRGFRVGGVAGLQDLTLRLAADPVRYVYRSTPRTEIADRIYTSTEYPAHVEIPLHNENAFQREWPLKVLFYCQKPAVEGGQTSLASTVNVTASLPQRVVDRFMEKGVMYVRNYGSTLDLPWQTVFQTQSPGDVDVYCQQHGIDVEWLPAGRLRTRQVCQVVASHPRTHATVWFNQAHLFHVSSVGAEVRKALLSMFKEADLPRHAYHADGSAIDEHDLEAIRDAFGREKVLCTWRQGDVLMLDNMLVSHGRMPYRGERSLLTAMAEPCSSTAQPSSFASPGVTSGGRGGGR